MEERLLFDNRQFCTLQVCHILAHQKHAVEIAMKACGSNHEIMGFPLQGHDHRHSRDITGGRLNITHCHRQVSATKRWIVTLIEQVKKIAAQPGLPGHARHSPSGVVFDPCPVDQEYGSVPVEHHQMRICPVTDPGQQRIGILKLLCQPA